MKKEPSIGFDLTFRRLYPRLVAYASLMVEKEDARDIVQEVFVWLLKHPERFQSLPPAELERYLLKSVYHKCLNHIRGLRSDKVYRDWFQSHIEDEYARYNPDNDPLVEMLFLQDVRKEVQDLISQLPQKCREVFLLAYGENLPHRRIADITGISLSTVHNHVYNAMKFLREKLSAAIIEKKFHSS